MMNLKEDIIFVIDTKGIKKLFSHYYLKYLIAKKIINYCKNSYGLYIQNTGKIMINTSLICVCYPKNYITHINTTITHETIHKILHEYIYSEACTKFDNIALDLQAEGYI
jgi:hypothetical protein